MLAKGSAVQIEIQTNDRHFVLLVLLLDLDMAGNQNTHRLEPLVDSLADFVALRLREREDYPVEGIELANGWEPVLNSI